MPEKVKRAKVSHSIVGAALGLDVPTVSRLRGGVRQPSIKMLIRLRNAYGWQPNDAIVAIESGRFVDAFEKMLDEHYSRRGQYK